MGRKKIRQVRFVANWERMDGNTDLEKMLNSYLSTQFVPSYAISSDECLSEARMVINIVRAYGESADSGAAIDVLGRAEFGSEKD